MLNDILLLGFLFVVCCAWCRRVASFVDEFFVVTSTFIRFYTLFFTSLWETSSYSLVSCYCAKQKKKEKFPHKQNARMHKPINLTAFKHIHAN